MRRDLSPSRYLDDDEMLADLALGQLEQEAERLVAMLLAAEPAVIALYPGLLADLNANAAAYGEARDNWIADLRCGDLSFDQADARAIQLGTLARNEMYGMVLGAERMELRADDLELCEDAANLGVEMGPGAHLEPERWALFQAAAALHGFLAKLHDEIHGDIAEHVADALGDAGPRYVLGH